MNNFADQIKRVSGISLEIALGVFLAAMLLYAWKSTPVNAASKKAVSGSSGVLAAGGTLCMRDNQTGAIFTLDMSGNYTFTNCAGFTLTGTGTVIRGIGIAIVTDFQPGRRVAATFNLGQLTGSATIFFNIGPGQVETFRVIDTTSQLKICACPI